MVLQAQGELPGVEQAAAFRPGSLPVDEIADLILFPAAFAAGHRPREGDGVDGLVGARHVVLANGLGRQGQGQTGIEIAVEAHIGVPLLVTGGGLYAGVAAAFEVVEILQGHPRQKAPGGAVVGVEFETALVRVLGTGVASEEPAPHPKATPLGSESRLARHRVDGPADGVAPVENAGGAAHEFQAVQGIPIHRAPVLVGAAAHGGMVEADPIHQHQGAVAGEAADIRRGLPVGGLLHHHRGLAFQGLGNGPSLQERMVEKIAGPGGVERILLEGLGGDQHLLGFGRRSLGRWRGGRPRGSLAGRNRGRGEQERRQSEKG